MATTAGDLASLSLKLLLVEASDAPLEADDYADYLVSLNHYMAGLESDGLRLGFTPVSNVSDEITCPAGAMRGIAANVALDVAPMYGGRLSSALIKMAQDGLKTLQRLGVHIGSSSYPDTLPGGAGNYSTEGIGFYFGPTASALITLAGNTVATNIVTAGTAVKVRGLWDIQGFELLSPDITGRITNGGPKVTVTVTAEMTLKAAGSIAAGVLALTRNGVSQATVTAALSTTAATVTLTHSLEIEPGEYLEFTVKDPSTTYDITATDATVRVSGSSSTT